LPGDLVRAPGLFTVAVVNALLVITFLVITDMVAAVVVGAVGVPVLKVFRVVEVLDLWGIVIEQVRAFVLAAGAVRVVDTGIRPALVGAGGVLRLLTVVAGVCAPGVGVGRFGAGGGGGRIGEALASLRGARGRWLRCGPGGGWAGRAGGVGFGR
jgi:hypothetical protein